MVSRGNVACAQPPRIVRAEQRTAMLLQFNAFSEEMALKKGENYFSRNFVYVLRTTTTRHMVSFIDFYIHFLASFQNETSPHMFSILTHVMKPVRDTHSELGLPLFLHWQIDIAAINGNSNFKVAIASSKWP